MKVLIVNDKVNLIIGEVPSGTGALPVVDKGTAVRAAKGGVITGELAGILSRLFWDFKIMDVPYVTAQLWQGQHMLDEITLTDEISGAWEVNQASAIRALEQLSESDARDIVPMLLTAEVRFV